MTADRTWTDLDLERFHDGDLPDADRDALAADLRRDARLRERLAGVIALDTRVRSTLLGEAPARSPRLTLRGPILLGSITAVAAAAAASLALVLGGSIMLGSRQADLPPQVAVEPVPAAPDQEQAVRDAFRTAREFGIRLTVREAPEAAPAPREPDPSRSDMLALLDQGDLDGALRVARRDRSVDGAVWAAVGERLRSGLAAEEILNALPPEEQLEVCRAWVARPSLRPVTFAWLARLGESTDPALRAAVADLRNDLAEQPGLESWLRSYASR